MWADVKGFKCLVTYGKGHSEISIQSNLIEKIYLFEPSASRQTSFFYLNIEPAHFIFNLWREFIELLSYS